MSRCARHSTDAHTDNLAVMQWWADAWNSVARFFGYQEWVWGTVADWFAALGTVAAVAVAIFLVIRESTHTKRGQAEQVTVRIVDAVTSHAVDITNRSTEHFPYVEVYWRKTGERGRPKSTATFPETEGEDLNPGEHVLLFEEMPKGIEYTGTVLAVMCDARGRIWYRDVTRDKYISARRSRQFTRGVTIPFAKVRWYRAP